MNNLSKQFKQQLKDKTLPKYKSWLGHKVQVLDKDGQKWVGKLTYLGASVDSSVLQATIDATPIFPIQLNTLKLV